VPVWRIGPPLGLLKKVIQLNIGAECYSTMPATMVICRAVLEVSTKSTVLLCLSNLTGTVQYLRGSKLIQPITIIQATFKAIHMLKRLY